MPIPQKKYNSYQALKKDLLQHWKGYDKSNRFFRSLKNGLFSELKETGDFEEAVKRSKRSLRSKMTEGRNHTYSEIHLFLEAIQII